MLYKKYNPRKYLCSFLFVHICIQTTIFSHGIIVNKHFHGILLHGNNNIHLVHENPLNIISVDDVNQNESSYGSKELKKLQKDQNLNESSIKNSTDTSNSLSFSAIDHKFPLSSRNLDRTSTNNHKHEKNLVIAKKHIFEADLRTILTNSTNKNYTSGFHPNFLGIKQKIGLTSERELFSGQIGASKIDLLPDTAADIASLPNCQFYIHYPGTCIPGSVLSSCRFCRAKQDQQGYGTAECPSSSAFPIDLEPYYMFIMTTARLKTDDKTSEFICAVIKRPNADFHLMMEQKKIVHNLMPFNLISRLSSSGDGLLGFHFKYIMISFELLILSILLYY